MIDFDKYNPMRRGAREIQHKEPDVQDVVVNPTESSTIHSVVSKDLDHWSQSESVKNLRRYLMEVAQPQGIYLVYHDQAAGLCIHFDPPLKRDDRKRAEWGVRAITLTRKAYSDLMILVKKRKVNIKHRGSF